MNGENTIVEAPKETPLEEPKETPKESAKEEPKDDGIPIEDAKNLYRMLNNPRTAKALVSQLAKELDLSFETKAETKESKATLKDTIKAALGDKFDFMGEEMGTAFEQAFAQFEAKIDAKLNTLTTQQQAAAAEASVAKLYDTYEDMPKFENRILELMDEMPRPEGDAKTLDKYMRNLYRIAKSEASETDAKTSMTKKMSDNKQDATAKLAASGSSRNSESSGSAAKAMSLDAALEAAIKKLETS